MSMSRTLPLLVPLLFACTVDLKVPEAAQVSCRDTSDCPGGSRCVTEANLCSVPGVDDAVPPQLLELDLQPTAGTVGTVFTLRFSVSEPLLVEPVVSDNFEQRWVKQPESTPLSYVYRYTAAFGVADGALSVSVRLVDHGGNLERQVAGNIVVDADGPDIYPSRLIIVSNPPGVEDTIAGEAETTEPGATLELFADLELTERLWSLTADEEGGFPTVSLGDNFVDQATGVVSGTSWYWLRATDPLGNHGPIARITTEVEPPPVEILSVERLATSPLDGSTEWVAARTFRATPGQATARVRVLIAGQLVALPRLLVGDLADVSCALVELGPAGGTYECLFAPPEGAAEDVELKVVARSFGTGNVGAASAGTISIDAALPPAPGADKVSVTMSPAGEDDLLVLQPGAVEPGATVVVFQTLILQDQSGTRCELATSATARADDTGALTLSLGDNEVGSFLVRQIDPAGNDPCPSCVNGGCAASVPLVNDIHGPNVQVLSTAGAFTADTEAQFSFQVAEQGPMADGEMVVHPPVTLACWLDGTPLDCGEEIELTGLSPARHKLEYRGTDALGNVSGTRSFEWTVQPVDGVLDAPLRERPSHRSYVIDEAGLGHLYVGGKALYAFHETARGDFTSEIISDRPVVSVVAARDGGTTWVAWQHPDERPRAADVMLARNDGTGWQTQVVTRVVSPVDELELTIDEGVPVLFVLRCRTSTSACFTAGANNNAFAVEAHRVLATGPVMEPVPDTLYARGLRAVTDGQGTTWLLHAERPSGGAVALKLHQRSAGVWQPAITIEGDGAPAMGHTNFSLFPGLALGAGGLPVASFSPDFNQPIWSATYTRSGFTFHNHNRNGEHVALTTSDGLIREVFGAWDIPVHECSAAGEWSQSSLTYSHHPSSITATQQDDELHVVVGRLQDVRTPLDRIIEGGDAQELAPIDGYAGFAPMTGAALPTLVVSAEGALKQMTYDGTAWTVAETIRFLPAGMGHSLSAVTDGESAWVAHLDGTSGDLWVERRDVGGTWSTIGPVNGWGQSVRNVQVKLRGDGVPVVVFQSSNRLYGTWWDGAAFVTPVELHALNGMYDLTNLALVGDYEGKTWAVFGDTNQNKVKAIRFASTKEEPLSCEGCGLVDVAPVSGTPYVSADVAPDGSLQVMVSSAWQTFALFTWDDGAWSSTNLNGRISGYRRGAPGEGWLPLENDCFAEGPVYPQQTAAFGFDAAGRRLIQAKVSCYRWSLGNGPVEMLAVETSPGEYAAYPLATSNDSGMELMRAVLPSDKGAVVVWGDPASATVSSFSTDSL